MRAPAPTNKIIQFAVNVGRTTPLPLAWYRLLRHGEHRLLVSLLRGQRRRVRRALGIVGHLFRRRFSEATRRAAAGLAGGRANGDCSGRRATTRRCRWWQRAGFGTRIEHLYAAAAEPVRLWLLWLPPARRPAGAPSVPQPPAAAPTAQPPALAPAPTGSCGRAGSSMLRADTAASRMTSVSAMSAATSISADSYRSEGAPQQPMMSTMTTISAATSDGAVMMAPTQAPMPAQAAVEDPYYSDYSYYSDAPGAKPPGAAATAQPRTPAAAAPGGSDPYYSYSSYSYSYSEGPTPKQSLAAATAGGGSLAAGAAERKDSYSYYSYSYSEGSQPKGSQVSKTTGAATVGTDPVDPTAPAGARTVSAQAGGDEYEYAYVYEDETKKAAAAPTAAQQPFASARSAYSYSYEGSPRQALAAGQAPGAAPSAQPEPPKDADLAARAAAAAAAVGAAAAKAAAAAAAARAASGGIGGTVDLSMFEGDDMDASARSFALSAADSRDGRLPSRTPSEVAEEDRATRQAEMEAARAAHAAAVAAAATYNPLEPPMLNAGGFADEEVLDYVGEGLAERARHFHAASERVHAALQKQQDTLRRLQFAAARLQTELCEPTTTPELTPPADGWDVEEPAPIKNAFDTRGRLAQRGGVGGGEKIEQGVLKLLQMHAAENESPFVALARKQEPPPPRVAMVKPAAPPSPLTERGSGLRRGSRSKGVFCERAG